MPFRVQKKAPLKINPGLKEELMHQAWELAVKRYPFQVIGRELGIDRKVVSRYVKEMSKRLGKSRQQQALNALEIAFASEEAIIANIWSDLAKVDQAIEEEEERRIAYNAWRAGQRPPKQPISKANWDASLHIKNKKELYSELGKAQERWAKLAHLMGVDEAAQQTLIAVQINTLREMLSKPVVLDFPEAIDIPADFLEDTEDESQRLLMQQREARDLAEPIDAQFTIDPKAEVDAILKRVMEAEL